MKMKCKRFHILNLNLVSHKKGESVIKYGPVLKSLGGEVGTFGDG